ncbi:hypothetical protein B0H14DRAFT_2609297 [Mycena olivaceomarginata]|nr:hypothetical protein B0H14DRAFT_2609297 [Mycena olivaceomarginata]
MPWANTLKCLLPKITTGRPKQSKMMTVDEMELDGIEMISLEIPVEPDVQPDAVEQGYDADQSEASQSESGNLDVDGELFLGRIPLAPAQQQSKIVVSSHIHTFSCPSSPLQTTEATGFHLSILTKAGASKTHDDVPVQESKKTEAAVAPKRSASGKKRRRKPEAWSVRHTDDQIYMSLEFLAQFPEEYRELLAFTYDIIFSKSWLALEKRIDENATWISRRLRLWILLPGPQHVFKSVRWSLVG